MKVQIAVVATAAGLAAAAVTPPDAAGSQYPGCSSGQGKRAYDQGVRLASSAFTTSWNFLEQDCAQLDVLVDIMDETAPYKPYCKTLGYIDALYEKYAEEQKSCYNDCKDSGEMTGYALAGQFCTITQAAAMAFSAFGAPQRTTLAICNELEQQKCEQKYASEVNRNCPEAKADNLQYYNDLKKSCQIGGDSGKPGPGDQPVVGPPCDTCEDVPPPPPCDPCDDTPAKPTPEPKPEPKPEPPTSGETDCPVKPCNTEPPADAEIDCATPGKVDTRCR